MMVDYLVVKRWPLFSLDRERFLKQVGVDSEADLNRPAEDLAGGGHYGVRKGILQPILKEQVGHPNRQRILIKKEFGVALKPEIKTWLSDAPGNILAQRRHDVAVATCQGFLPGELLNSIPCRRA
jgi:hypothetical protein